MSDRSWIEYTAGDREAYITPDRWGKDHWSTLAYAETRTVDYKGILDNRHMRCNSRLHRVFAHQADGSDYPTRLRNGEIEERHDDWSCLEDAVAMDLIKMQWQKPSAKIFGGATAKVQFTPEGLRIVADLRAYKASGRNYAEFKVLEDINWEEKMQKFLSVLS